MSRQCCGMGGCIKNYTEGREDQVPRPKSRIEAAQPFLFLNPGLREHQQDFRVKSYLIPFWDRL